MAVSAKEAARQEAIRWSIRLQEHDSSDGDLDAFFAWFGADDRNAQAWAEIEYLRAAATSSDIESKVETRLHRRTTEMPAASPPGKPVPQREFARTAQRSPSRAGMYIAALAASIAFVVVINNVQDLWISLQADHETRTGEARRVILPDGSSIHLSARTAVAVEMRDDLRRVHLLKGTAFFNIVRDEGKPFVVRHGRVNIRVVGTSFEVRSMISGSSVSVRSGGVSVSREPRKPSDVTEAHTSALLRTGEQIRLVRATGQSTKSNIAPTDVAPWRSGRLVVRDWTAKDVYQALRSHYPGYVLNGSLGFSSTRLTGVYDLQNPESALRIFAAAQGLRLRKISNGLLALSPI
ncbi:MAG: FecR domain-containing protein [Pseudomonadota bacterium]